MRKCHILDHVVQDVCQSLVFVIQYGLSLKYIFSYNWSEGSKNGKNAILFILFIVTKISFCESGPEGDYSFIDFIESFDIGDLFLKR